jgi:hypothetical protein
MSERQGFPALQPFSLAIGATGLRFDCANWLQLSRSARVKTKKRASGALFSLLP